MIKPSKLLEEKVSYITSKQNDNWLKVNMIIKSYKNSDLKIIPSKIENINISNLYSINTMPNIQILVKLRMTELLLIINNLQSLYVDLTMKYVNPLTLEENLSEKVIRKTYHLHIPNLEDLYKKFNFQQLTETDENTLLEQHVGNLIPIGLQLLDVNEFRIRKRNINVIFQQVTIKDVILFVAHNLGFNKINYIDKFNPSFYQNFHIPISYGKFDVIFNYLQKKYGIYDKGFNYFYYNDVLYIYPMYDFSFERKNESILHIYKVAPGTYNGMKSYHRYVDNDLYIVSNSDLINHKLSTTLLENIGTNVVFLNSRTLIDKFKKINSDGTVDIANDIVNLSTYTDNKIFDKSVTVDYSNPSLNIYEQSSKIAERNTEIIMTEWAMARPFTTIPGNRIKFYYDQENGITMRNGLLENVEFQLKRIEQMTSVKEDFFVCNAKMQIRLNQI